MIQLAEPHKTPSLTFDGTLEIPRRAFVNMYDGAAKLLYEAIVDLGATRGPRCLAGSPRISSST